ncbi:MAG: UMP kinase [Patescibacteria group bacterium]|nr:UMP kinase [Patescibacteria group bacterium]
MKQKNQRRIVIKLSGEVFEIGDQPANLDFPSIEKIARSLIKLIKLGYQVGAVVGAGNIFRARMVKGEKIDRVVADHMGMLATNLNALALQSVLEKLGQPARVLSAYSIPKIMEDYSHRKAVDHLENKRVVIFAGGTGNPYFTTDTTLVLRALEVGASHIYKASNIDGVYDSNPKENKKAKLYKKLSYRQALSQNLEVMDQTAFALAKDNDLPLTVFKYSPANLVQAVVKNNIGTKVVNQ